MYTIKHRRELDQNEKCPGCNLGWQPLLVNDSLPDFLICMKCRTIFMSKPGLESAREEARRVVDPKAIHEITIEDLEPPPEIKDFTCLECGKTCKSRLGLTSHMRVHK